VEEHDGGVGGTDLEVEGDLWGCRGGRCTISIAGAAGGTVDIRGGGSGTTVHDQTFDGLAR
jgi:hypothetical protein